MKNAKSAQNDFHHDKVRYREFHDKSASTADDVAHWFIVVALCAFLTAGLFVYRAATSDGRIALSGTRTLSVAEMPSAVEQPPIHTHVEGADP
jgi:hypothetical protein